MWGRVMRNKIINTPRGRMTKLQFIILQALKEYPNESYTDIADGLGTSRMHVWRAKTRFLGKRKRRGRRAAGRSSSSPGNHQEKGTCERPTS